MARARKATPLSNFTRKRRGGLRARGRTYLDTALHDQAANERRRVLGALRRGLRRRARARRTILRRARRRLRDEERCVHERADGARGELEDPALNDRRVLQVELLPTGRRVRLVREEGRGVSG